MKNAIESSLPEVSINGTNYYAGGRLKFSTLECKEMGKVQYPPRIFGEMFDSLISSFLILLAESWGGEMIQQCWEGGPFSIVLVRSLSKCGLSIVWESVLWGQ